MKITIYKCARCGEDHKDLEMKKFKNPVVITFLKWEEYIIPYWTMCPVVNEPILIDEIKEE